jgi:hypothetical protein
MATDANKDGLNNPDQDTNKVTFDEKQQAFINDMFDKRFGKIKADHQKELDAERAAKDAAQAKLDAATKTPTDTDTTAEADKKQIKALLEAEKAKTKNAEMLAEQRKREADEARSDSLKVKKEVAIQRSASKQNFHELETVTKLTWDNVEYDDESKSFVVKENGIIKQNSSLQNMSLDEYFAGFAAQRPYLVNGDAVGGAGSSESRGGGGTAIVKTKADLKNAKEKSDFIGKFGLEKFEALPAK